MLAARTRQPLGRIQALRKRISGAKQVSTLAGGVSQPPRRRCMATSEPSAHMGSTLAFATAASRRAAMRFRHQFWSNFCNGDDRRLLYTTRPTRLAARTTAAASPRGVCRATLSRTERAGVDPDPQIAPQKCRTRNCNTPPGYRSPRARLLADPFPGGLASRALACGMSSRTNSSEMP
jgi:hypothetical protein